MTPIVLDDRRYRNGSTFAGHHPYLLHAQWHKISTTVEKNVESMALIVVYRYDVFYIPWSVKESETVMDTDAWKNNVTVASRTSNTTNNSSPAPTSSNLPVNDQNKNDSSSTKSLSWEPWAHGPVRRITTSGSGQTIAGVGVVSNGIADYLYESKTR